MEWVLSNGETLPTGTEVIRRKAQGEAFAPTVPLITKTDGILNSGNLKQGENYWLDAKGELLHINFTNFG